MLSLKTSLLSLMLGAGVLLVGCQSTGKSGESAAAPTTQAVTCSKCQVTWVKVPMEGGKGRIIGYTTRQSMVCPDCRSAVDNFFKTGKLQHTCKTCGSALEVCEGH